MSLPELTQAQKEGFFNKFQPYAQQASKALDMPVSVILAQWAHESWYGYSDLAQRANNYAGIKYSKNTVGGGQSGAYAAYSSISVFVQDYIRVLKLSYYDKVRTEETSKLEYIETAEDLGKSPFAESHYGGAGQSILSLISQYNLVKYDNGQAVTVPTQSQNQVTRSGANITVPVGDSTGIAAGVTVVAVGILIIASAVGAVIPKISEEV